MTDVRLYIETSLMGGGFKQDPEPFEAFDDNYFMLGLNIGLRVPLLAELSSYEGQLENELIFNYAGGNEKNLGSHRFQLGWMTGWKQNFFDVPFVRGLVGIGFNENWLNFGRGVPLEKEFNTSIITQFELGVDLCSKKRALCVSPAIGVRYEKSLTEPYYENLGLVGTITLSGSFNTVDRGVYEQDMAALKIENTRLQEKAREAELAKEYAESQTVMMGQLNKRLTETIDELKNPGLQKPNYLDMVIEFSAEGESDPDQDLMVAEKDGEEIHKQLDYLAVQLKTKSLRLRLHGHTVPSGNASHDQIQSYKYAKAVKDYLVDRGVPNDKAILDAKLVGADGLKVKSDEDLQSVTGNSIHGSDSVIDQDKACEKKRCVSFELIFKSNKP